MINLVAANDLIDDIYIDMRRQFPVDELKPLSHFKKILNSSLYKAFRCFDGDVEIGYILCFIDDYILVDYLAIYKEYQSNGYGRRILEKLFEIYSSKKAVLFEVEKMDITNPNTIRRQEFYKKIGCVNSSIDYFFPSYNHSIPMDLLYYSLSDNILDRSDLLNFIRKFFEMIHFDVDCRSEVYSKIN